MGSQLRDLYRMLISLSVLEHNSNDIVERKCRGDRDYKKIDYLRNY